MMASLDAAAIVPVQLPKRRWLQSFRHEGFYEAMLVHPDGQRLIAARRDGSVTVWRIADGTVVHHLAALLSAHELDEARSLHMSLHPDGKRLFVTVVIVDTSDVTFAWDLDSGVSLDSYDYPKVPEHFVGDELALSAHGLYLTLWNLRTHETALQLLREERSWQVSSVVQAHGALAAAAVVTMPDGLELWDLESGKLRWKLEGSFVERGYGAAFDDGELGGATAMNGGQVLLSRRGALEVRSAADGSVIRTIACDVFGPLTFGPAKRRVVIQGSDELCAVDVQTGEVLSTFAASEVDSLQLEHFGSHAVVRTGFGLSALVWELASGKCLLRANDPLAFVPEQGARAATAITLEGYTLRQWPLGEDALATSPTSPRPPYPTTCPAGTISFAVTPAGKLRLQRVADCAPAVSDGVVANGSASDHPVGTSGGTSGGGSVGPSVELAPRGYPRVLALEPHAQRIALSVGNSSGQTIELWRGTAPPLRLHTFRTLTSAACAAFDPSRRWLLSGHHDGSLHLWDTSERRRAALVETGPTTVVEVAISPAGDRVVALSADQRLRGYLLETLHPLAQWHSESALHELRWLDDETLVASSADGEVRLRWAAATATA